MNVRASQVSLHVPWEVGLQGYVDMAKQTGTVLAGIAGVMKSQRCQPQPYPRRSWACPEDLLRRSNFLHGTGSFATKEGWIKTLLGYVIAQYYLLPDSITFWNCTNSHQMVQNTDVQHFNPQTLQFYIAGYFSPPLQNGEEAVQRLNRTIQRALWSTELDLLAIIKGLLLVCIFLPDELQLSIYSDSI